MELEDLSDNNYWMLESGQYAGSIWEEQKTWERGTPPCPLWSIILHSLCDIEYTIILDKIKYLEETKGYESTFHFEKIEKIKGSVIENTREVILQSLIPICSNCKKIRTKDNVWESFENYFIKKFDTNFTHSICPECYKELYPDLD